MQKTFKQNEQQLKRLEFLIEDAYLADFSKKSIIIKEFESILKNKSFDINNDMSFLQKPLLVSAAIWNSKEIIELLVKYGADINAKVNFYNLYGEGEEKEYCKNEDVSTIELLLEKRTELLKILEENHKGIEVQRIIKLELEDINNCIAIIENEYKKSISQ